MPELEFIKDGAYVDKTGLPENVIHWTDARCHLGERVSIYGEVASTFFDYDEYERWVPHYDLGLDLPPTFLEVGAKFPEKNLVKIVIWGRDRVKFDRPPDVLFRDEAIIFTGEPYVYNDLVCVKISSPSDIRAVQPISGLYHYDYHYDDEDEDYYHSSLPSSSSYSSSSESYGGCSLDDYDSYDDYLYARGILEYRDDCDRRVSKVGDYFYDDDGNVVDDVREIRTDWD